MTLILSANLKFDQKLAQNIQYWPYRQSGSLVKILKGQEIKLNQASIIQTFMNINDKVFILFRTIF